MNKWEGEDAVKIRVSSMIHSFKKGIKCFQHRNCRNTEVFPASATSALAHGLSVLVRLDGRLAINEGRAELFTREDKEHQKSTGGSVL